MRRALLAAAVLAAFGPAVRGDELVLKGGKRLPWKTITDNGDTYTVENGVGQRLTIPKEDVERIEKSPVGPPLAGASFTFDKKTTVTVDLLARADVKGEGTSGDWKRQGPSVAGSAGPTAHAKLPLPFSPLPEEYDVTLVAERKERCNALYVGIVAAGNQCTVMLDAIEGSLCGLQLIDGKTFYEGEGNGTKAPGPVFKNNAPRTVRLIVRKAAFVAQVDGKDVVAWRADWKKVSNQPALAIPQRDLLYIGVYDSSWRISSATLTYMK